MGVPRETVSFPFAVGSVKVPQAVRGENGRWSVEFRIEFRVRIDDTRDVLVRRTVSLQATEQLGRKARR